MNVWKLLVLILFSKFCWIPDLAAREYPRIVKGVLDVRAWDFEKDGILPVEGEAEFYWNEWMHPDPAQWDGAKQPKYIDVKGGWQKSGFPLYGKGTYRIRIESDRPVKLAIGLLRSATDTALFANGSLQAKTRRTPEGKLFNSFATTVLSEHDVKTYDLIFHVENKEYFVSGIIGIDGIGHPQAVYDSYVEKSVLYSGVFFALIMLALYNVGLFAVNRKDLSPILIALCCLAVCGLIAGKPGLKEVVFHEADTYLFLKIYNMSFVGAIALCWLYMKSVFTHLCHSGAAKWVSLACLPAIILTMLTEPAVYLGINRIYLGIGALTLLYMIVLALRAVRGRVLGAKVFLLAICVSTVFNVVEALIAEGMIREFPAAATGMLFFCFCQSLILSMRFAETLRQVRRSEIEIRSLNDELQEKEKARTLFFHNTSHELRTPLNGIIGFLDLIEQERYGAITDAARQQLSKVKSLAVSLKQQVNTILDLAKSKQGKLALRNIQFPLRTLVVDSQNLAEGLNLKKPLVSFSLETRGFDPDTLWIHDYEKIFTIVRNLIGNAFKFTAIDKASQVHLSLELMNDQSLSIVVHDTGIGIPASHKDKIFQEFQQVESDARRSYEGTGLGLAMVRDLLNLMNGKISVESEEGKGSTFSVRIPAQTVIHAEEGELMHEWTKPNKPLPIPKATRESEQPVARRTDTPEPESRKLILVVDDNEMNCEVVRDILSLEGYEVALAFGGRDALHKLHEQHPDLVLLDLMMPEVSGEDVLQAMKADPELDNIPVILLTARATEEDRIHGLELGADDYLAKPLIARELILRVHNLLLRIESTRLLEGVEQREKMALMGELLSDLSHELKNIHHADAYNSKNLQEYVEPLLRMFPYGGTVSLTAGMLLDPSVDISEAQRREQILLSSLSGKPERHDRRLALYLSALAAADEEVLALWQWARALPLEWRRAFESLLAMLQHVNSLSQSSERTQELITAVLDYGRYQKAQSTVDVSRVIASSLTFLQARFRRAGIQVENRVPAAEVQASSSDLQQIALNILSNAYDAVKELKSEQERVIAISMEEDSEHKLIRLRFVNKGPGIPQEVLPHIFERRFTTKGEKGSGLGLYVSRRLAVKNHGDLQAASREGATAFELTLRKAG